MEKLFTFKNKTYYLYYGTPEGMWDVIFIYSYNPHKWFFKKKFLTGYNVVCTKIWVNDFLKKDISKTEDCIKWCIKDFLKIDGE